MHLADTKHTHSPYMPGVERWSLYRSLWNRYAHEFVVSYSKRFGARYGLLSNEKCGEIKKIVECGHFTNGFVFHACPSCGTKLAVPFTCKSRLCLSCRRKSLFGWSTRLSELIDPGLRHVHATFTVPGRVLRMIERSGFDENDLVPLAAGAFVRLLRLSKAYDRDRFMPGMVAVLHKCGNSLNYNPHVHLVGTTDMVHRGTGELCPTAFIHYTKARHLWMHAVCSILVRRGVISPEVAQIVIDAYPDGFHVYFSPIRGGANEILGRTAEYIASGFFHNSQITGIDHRKKTVTFRFKKHVDRKTGAKTYGEMTMDVFEFMARMLHFLPEKHSKQIRWYGIYANGVREKLARIRKNTWAMAVKHCFDRAPERCPRCGETMVRFLVYASNAVLEAKRLWRTHACVKGYFIPYRNDP